MNSGCEKILFYAPIAPPIGGIASWFDLILSNKPNAFEYEYVNSSVSTKRQNAKGLLKRILSVFEVSKQFRMIKRKIRVFKPDILHIATSGGNGFIRDKKFIKYANKNGVKTVIHLHFGRVNELLTKSSAESNNMRKVFDNTDKIIAIDLITYNSLLSSGYAKKAVFIPNPIKNQSYNYNENSKKIMYVGTLNQNKGIKELIDAFNGINRTDFSLDLYGPCDDEEEIKKIIFSNQNPNISFKGEISHDTLMNLYSNYSFLVLPSYTEGMPYCLLEAMSFGVPIIATSVGNIPNMVCDKRMIIKPKSTQELKDKMLVYIENASLRNELSLLSYKKTQQEFSLDNILKQMIDLWRSLYEN